MTNRYLPTPLRRALEKAIKDARLIAEEGAGDAIRRLGVADGKAPSYLNDAERELRRRLRAHARALGDVFNKSDETQETKRLVEAAAYAHWHRMLFARFLAERDLLRNPEHDVPVSLEDCRELAEAEGLTDPWVIAERYAASMLPAVFRIVDPVLAIELDPVHTQKLHRLVTGLNVEIFQAEDSLGWTYQFWRGAEKDAVNASGVKIGADELPAVTQLFTEPYMVRFLLHNTLGAWWAGKVLAANPTLAQSAADEKVLRAACSLPNYVFDMLRFVREGVDGPWRPAAGTFPGWPKEAKAITMLDPCCGSGHFLTEALAILAALRQADEHLSPTDAVAASLRDNLYGLEIDGRCVQIAAFAVALSSWRLGGWQKLPLPHIAWVGAPPPLPLQEFTSLAANDIDLQTALSHLWALFSNAPVIGSFLNPVLGDLVSSQRLGRLESQIAALSDATRKIERSLSPELTEGAVAARGMADAIRILSTNFHLIATNVPFLGRVKQSPEIKTHLDQHFKNAKGDTATAMIFRLLDLACDNGVAASVSPHNWFFTKSYAKFRTNLLTGYEFSFAATLGEEAWLEFGDRGPLAVLTAIKKTSPSQASKHFFLDALPIKIRDEKIQFLANGGIGFIEQKTHRQASDARIMLEPPSNGKPLKEYCDIHEGLHTGDYPQFGRTFWELQSVSSSWSYQQGGTGETDGTGGCEHVLFWEYGNGKLISQVEERLEGQPVSMWIKGGEAWGKKGVTIGTMRELKNARYFGSLFTHGIYVITPKDTKNLPALLAFANSRKLAEGIKKIDKRVVISKPAIEEVPFDLDYWSAAARNELASTVADPTPQDPTQWIFHGHPKWTKPGWQLHVALARQCGFRWPAEYDAKVRISEDLIKSIQETSGLPKGDDDGLLGVPPVAGEKSLADRLRAYLSATFGAEWSDALERRLVAEADEVLDKKVARDGSLEAWVRDRAFRQHCALFGQRPFLWHISDGQKDGFSVFVHYHRFDQSNLRKLTYTLLGDWLARAMAENNALRYEKGRELQQTLERVLEGEKPYDIFVRWKSLAQQPLGWDPDFDDGVRQNIRPFVKAGVLTHDLSKTLKDKDRGNDVTSAPWYSEFGGERRNDHHTTLAEKRAAREAASKRLEAAQ